MQQRPCPQALRVRDRTGACTACCRHWFAKVGGRRVIVLSLRTCTTAAGLLTSIIIVISVLFVPTTADTVSVGDVPSPPPRTLAWPNTPRAPLPSRLAVRHCRPRMPPPPPPPLLLPAVVAAAAAVVVVVRCGCAPNYPAETRMTCEKINTLLLSLATSHSRQLNGAWRTGGCGEIRQSLPAVCVCVCGVRSHFTVGLVVATDGDGDCSLL